MKKTSFSLFVFALALIGFSVTAATLQINNYEPAIKTFKVGQKIYDLYQEVSKIRKSQNQNDFVLSPPLTLTAENYLKHYLATYSQNISLKQLNYLVH